MSQKTPNFGKGPRGAMKGPVKKPKNISKTLKRLFGYMKEDTPKLILVFINVVLNSVALLGGAYLLRPIINNLATNIGNLEVGRKSLMQGLTVMAGVYIVGVIANYLQTRIMVGISQKALSNIRKDLFDKMQKLPIPFYDRNSHGELMSRYTNDVDAIGEMLNNTVVQFFSGTITIVGTLFCMIITNIYLTIITVVLVPFIIKIAGTIAKRSQKYFVQQQQAIGEINGYIEEAVTGQKVIKVFNHESIAVEEFSQINDGLREKLIHAQFIGGLMGPVMNNLNQINYTITATIGGILCITNGFDIGGLSIFANYARQFNRPISEISMQMNTIFSALAGAERVFDIMDEEMEPLDATNAVAMREVAGDVVLEKVTFGYTPEKVILKGISLYAKAGQKIAFVGSTGAGKTTITNLLNRFYEIQSGSITIDGVDIKQIQKEELRRHIAMVLQDTHLFTGTIRENIRYGRLDATDEEVIAAAKTASAHHFIMHLENGYDTVIRGDGGNLSQGQRQLLNIARAAISKAPILVLDEATSSVDTRTEKQIEQGMDRLMEERTTFVIAHRLSTVRNADAIMVLEDGEIIERGSHEELLEKKGKYYNLYTGAAELD